MYGRIAYWSLFILVLLAGCVRQPGYLFPKTAGLVYQHPVDTARAEKYPGGKVTDLFAPGKAAPSAFRAAGSGPVQSRGDREIRYHPAQRGAALGMLPASRVGKAGPVHLTSTIKAQPIKSVAEKPALSHLGKVGLLLSSAALVLFGLGFLFGSVLFLLWVSSGLLALTGTAASAIAKSKTRDDPANTRDRRRAKVGFILGIATISAFVLVFSVLLWVALSLGGGHFG